MLTPNGVEVGGFYVTQILREINFGEFRSSKVFFAILEAGPEFCQFGNFSLLKVQK